MLALAVGPLTLTLCRPPATVDSSRRRRRAAAAALQVSARPRMVASFDPGLPISEALKPPSSWYTDSSFLDLELRRVFSRGWHAVGYVEQVKTPYDFFCGRLGMTEFVISRDANGNLHAFYNVCRHNSTILACGSGQKSCFVCPYHGWTYGPDGALLKATRILGRNNFNKNDFSLKEIKVTTWGPFVLIRLDDDTREQNQSYDVAEEWLGSAATIFDTEGITAPLNHVCRREYTIGCNWKVFCDNYLDGGYHVPYAHQGLAASLDLQSYEVHIHESVSIQKCKGASSGYESDRLGSKACYAFVYPNFMINRYGPWMDTNLVVPVDSTKCRVVFDYFLDKSLIDDETFIEESLEDSERVQMEDIALCELVQRGLESCGDQRGIYLPGVEDAMHHFHRLLHSSIFNLD